MTRTENDLTSPRVDRGGSCVSNGASWVRSASRDTVVPACRSYGIGFRAYLPGRVKR